MVTRGSPFSVSKPIFRFVSGVTLMEHNPQEFPFPIYALCHCLRKRTATLKEWPTTVFLFVSIFGQSREKVCGRGAKGRKHVLWDLRWPRPSVQTMQSPSMPQTHSTGARGCESGWNPVQVYTICISWRQPYHHQCRHWFHITFNLMSLQAAMERVASIHLALSHMFLLLPLSHIN